ncbi:MAG: sulfatase-like hydrolase/transferase, partial [Verrucomicrobiales bacterium]|nr:sulfatase-like hydrolase/transferase [Verrucomicrobiales bacterium]
MKCWLFALLLFLPCLSGGKPNIVFILADDLGWGDLSCYGQTTLQTPNLDQLAADGMKFSRHYAGSTVCAPSRCVLMTGLHTGHCRIRGNGMALLKPEDFTVAELLKENGYVTGCFGKWGIGHPPPLDDPNRNGFDQFY